MGGGGGGRGGRYSYGKSKAAASVAQQIRETEKATLGDGFGSQLATFFGELLKDVNERDDVAVNSRLTQLLKPLEKDLQVEIEPLFGGSVARRTYVDGIS